MQYKIYHGGRVIEPPEPIQQIYHGSSLIWERTAKKLFDTRLGGYIFTKSGILAPGYIIGGKSVDFYDITGKKAFSYDYNDIIDDGETAEFVWASNPSYSIAYIPDGSIAPKSRADYIINGSRITPEPMPDDSAAHWSSKSDNVQNYVKNNPLIIGENGADIYPASRPFAYINGKIRPVSYIRDGNIITDAAYVILSICGDKMVCAESDISIGTYGDVSATITIRDAATGEILAQPFSSRHRIMSYNASAERRRRYNIAGDYVLYYGQYDGKTYVFARNMTSGQEKRLTNYKGIPENIIYYDGTYLFLNGPRDIYRGSTPSDMDASDSVSIGDAEFGGYYICNWNKPGAYYQAGDGSIYVLGQSVNTDENRNSNYKVFRIQDFLEV